VNYDGHEGQLIIARPEDADTDGSDFVELPAEFAPSGLLGRDVVVRVSISDPATIELQLPNPDSPGSLLTADVRHLNLEAGVAAGSYTNGSNTSFGLYMVRSSSLLVVEIVSPDAGTLSRVRGLSRPGRGVL
jgi:hypothetical protein